MVFKMIGESFSVGTCNNFKISLLTKGILHISVRGTFIFNSFQTWLQCLCSIESHLLLELALDATYALGVEVVGPPSLKMEEWLLLAKGERKVVTEELKLYFF
jgi:hypothetical protein